MWPEQRNRTYQEKEKCQGGVGEAGVGHGNSLVRGFAGVLDKKRASSGAPEGRRG